MSNSYYETYGKPEFLSSDEIEQLNGQVKFFSRGNNKKLAYYEYGDPAGIPIIFFHGTGSHVHVMMLHKPAQKLGFRVIAPDRPGVGRSDIDISWTLLDYAEDMEKLADHLGIDKFTAIGISGGGPTLMACAYKIPHRISVTVDLACAMPLYSDSKMTAQLGTVDRLYAKLGPNLPLWLFRIPFSLLGFQQKVMKNPASFAKMMSSSMCEADRILFDEPDFQYLFMRDFQELFRQGALGPSYDAQRVYKDWGFDLAEIQTPVEIFHGTDDKWVPVKFSEYLADKVSGAKFHAIPNAGHFHHMVYGENLLREVKSLI